MIRAIIKEYESTMFEVTIELMPNVPDPADRGLDRSSSTFFLIIDLITLADSAKSKYAVISVQLSRKIYLFCLFFLKENLNPKNLLLEH